VSENPNESPKGLHDVAPEVEPPGEKKSSGRGVAIGGVAGDWWLMACGWWSVVSGKTGRWRSECRVPSGVDVAPSGQSAFFVAPYPGCAARPWALGFSTFGAKTGDLSCGAVGAKTRALILFGATCTQGSASTLHPWALGFCAVGAFRMKGVKMANPLPVVARRQWRA
jgi:hypothetical protein